ncbi:MAG: hypothetical protein K2J04_15410 [Lachnospiraceae bacterium]|nr:hypothetical protein [Lachnospiraceae bacterium]
MQQIFHSHGRSYNVEYFCSDNADMVRFFDTQKESHASPLSDLVIVEPSYGYILLQYIGDDAILSGSLNKEYFCEEITDDIIEFLEESFPKIRNVYLPYHIDFFTVDKYDEYNGEY